MIEAMGAGVPVISTALGGVDAFVTPDTAFPIGHRWADLEGDYLPYPQGFVWADPDVDSLASLLDRVHRDRAEAIRRAQTARARVLDFFCTPSLPATYNAELSRISAL